MAWKVQETHEGVAFKKYIGVAPVKVIAINPTKVELEKLGFKTDNFAGYTSTAEDGAKQIRIDFICQTVPEKCSVDMSPFKVSFTLRYKAVKSAATGKYQIMDAYGRTAWATKEEVDAKVVPQYTNGPAQIAPNYTILCEGEEFLTKFIRTYLGIPNITKFINGVPSGIIDNPADAEGRLEHIKDYFTGDISEIKDIIALAPNNWIKVAIGLRTTAEGRQFMNVYTREFVSGGSSNYKRLVKSIMENQLAGRYTDTEFGDMINNSLVLSEIHEVVVNATPVAPTNAPMPQFDNVNTQAFDAAAANNDDMPF